MAADLGSLKKLASTAHPPSRQAQQVGYAELRGLAVASGQPCVIDGVKNVRLFVLGNVMRPEELPNWNGAGGLN